MSETFIDRKPDRSLLKQLADAYGVATDFWTFAGELKEISSETLVKILGALQVDSTTEARCREALEAARTRPWRLTLPECSVVRAGSQAHIPVHLPDGAAVTMEVLLEEGGSFQIHQADIYTPPQSIDGQLIGQATFVIPEDMPLGYHTIRVRIVPVGKIEGEITEAPLIVVPEALPLPSERGADGWGVAAQLYSVRSRDSWGIGDSADLKELCSLFASMGAQYVLVNPLHAAEPTGPMTPSPYLPVSRRFFNPIYIRPEDIREVAYIPTAQRSLIEWASEKPKASSLENEKIDRDTIWDAKRGALEVIYQAGRSQARQRDFNRFREEQGQGLEDFALWCALSEKYPDGFPEGLTSPQSMYVQREKAELAERIDFFCWLQWIIDEQLDDAQRSAVNTGMKIGIFHDLAVGVHPLGADVWANPDMYARNMALGAPPDMYTQRGQNWSQPPWRPDSLRRAAYQPLAELVRTVLRHAGGLRVDHILGLFRQWWIPDGMEPSEGTYVYFDHEAMVGVLMLEAYRAGAVIVGEDLGTTQPWVMDYLRGRGILGTSVLWFEKNGDGSFKLPQHFSNRVMATVVTHDMPPAAAYLGLEHVELRNAYGLLTEPVEFVRAKAKEERDKMLTRLRERKLMDDFSPERVTVEALYRDIAQAPCELEAIALVDAVGEQRTQNQPGTNNECPNWRLPLADGGEKVVLIEDLSANSRLISLVSAFTDELARAHSAVEQM
ncbi:MAG: 4-alpha-glucanotransferase [Actinomycetaceae bacterium]|nr:4-alpha-glucanotransferase [Actinomycetaceae bacterium]